MAETPQAPSPNPNPNSTLTLTLALALTLTLTLTLTLIRTRRVQAAKLAKGRGRSALARKATVRRRRSSGSFPSKGSALDDALEEAEGRVHDLPPGIAHAAVVQAQERGAHAHGARAGAAGTKGIDKYLPQQALGRDRGDLGEI